MLTINTIYITKLLNRYKLFLPGRSSTAGHSFVANWKTKKMWNNLLEDNIDFFQF